MKNLDNKSVKKQSKRMREAYKVLVDNGAKLGQDFSLKQAINMLKKCPMPKFNASVDVVVKLNIDPTKSDQNVRGVADLPNGTGRSVKIAVFAQGEYQKQAKDAGADLIIGDEESARDFLNDLSCDYCVATPDVMSLLVKWGVSKVLGPKGLMPNAKLGTVTFDVKSVVENLKRGQAMYKNDKTGRLHTTIGLQSFETEKLVENAQSLIEGIKKSVPASVKSEGFIQNISVNMTMLPSLKVNVNKI